MLIMRFDQIMERITPISILLEIGNPVPNIPVWSDCEMMPSKHRTVQYNGEAYYSDKPKPEASEG
jgi:hypothetical protein